MSPVTEACEASPQLFADVVTGQHVEDGVDGTVDGGQSERDGVRRVHAGLGQTAVFQPGEVEEDGADQQDQVIRSEADQEQQHHRHRQPAHALLLLLPQPGAALHAGQDAAVSRHQQQQRDQETHHEPGVVKAHHRGAVLTRLEAAPVPLGGVALPHGEDGDVTDGDQQHDADGNQCGQPLPAQPAGLHAVHDGHVAVAGDAAQQEDADVHVVEEDVARQLAGGRAPGPQVTSANVVRPQRQRAQVGEVTQRQAQQVHAQHVLPVHLQPGEVDGQQVGGQADSQHRAVQQHQRQTALIIRQLARRYGSVIAQSNHLCHRQLVHDVSRETTNQSRLQCIH